MTTPTLHRRTLQFAGSCLAIGMLSACANWPPASTYPTTKGGCESSLSPADNTRLASIEQMAGEGKHYAALAQLDALGATSSQAQLVRADVLRRIDRDKDAQSLYQGLIGSCLDGRAQHGLGLLAARAGQTSASLAYLQQARQALPTDVRIRNDLGYALLLAGQLDAAQFEFLTVLDLSPQEPKASRNLVMLTFAQGRTDKALDLARKMGLDDSTTTKLQQQARALHNAPSTTPASSP